MSNDEKKTYEESLAERMKYLNDLYKSKKIDALFVVAVDSEQIISAINIGRDGTVTNLIGAVQVNLMQLIGDVIMKAKVQNMLQQFEEDQTAEMIREGKIQ